MFAAPGDCTITRSNGSSSVVCLPGTAPGTAGPPTWQDLPYQNSYRDRAGGFRLGGPP
jgi:hypothetical protein